MDLKSTKNALIQSTPELFPSLKHWQSFTELCQERWTIQENMILSATSKIRQHFDHGLRPPWKHIPCHAQARDTSWYLEEFGPQSITVNFNYYYSLLLFNQGTPYDIAALIHRALNTPKFDAIEKAFSRIDARDDPKELLRENHYFSFDHPSDYHFDEIEMAWMIFNNEASFVDQAIEKIERFTNDDDVTRQLHSLNELALREASQISSQNSHV